MATLKTIFQGDSLSIGFTFNAEYNTARIQNHYVYLGETLLTSTLVSTVIRVEMESVDTTAFIGAVKLMLVIDDSTFGIRKTDVGNIYFNQSTGISDESVNEGYNLVVSIDIDETATTSSVEILEAFKGAPGLSAYEIYLKYTTDDPILTEEEWINLFQGGVRGIQGQIIASDYITSGIFGVGSTYAVATSPTGTGATAIKTNEVTRTGTTLANLTYTIIHTGLYKFDLNFFASAGNVRLDIGIFNGLTLINQLHAIADIVNGVYKQVSISAPVQLTAGDVLTVRWKIATGTVSIILTHITMTLEYINWWHALSD